MRRAGFTLIELLIVLGILGVMALAVIPSFGGMGSLKVSLAAKDALRLMRYARKVAIQTQQPVTVAFSPGQIRVSVDGDEPAEDGAEAEAAREPEDDKPKQRRDSDRLEETDPESFNLTRACEEVAFGLGGVQGKLGRARVDDGYAQTDSACHGRLAADAYLKLGADEGLGGAATFQIEPFHLRGARRDKLVGGETESVAAA